MRAQIVGHELDDENHPVYSRQFTPREKLCMRSNKFSARGLSTLEFNTQPSVNFTSPFEQKSESQGEA